MGTHVGVCCVFEVQITKMGFRIKGEKTAAI